MTRCLMVIATGLLSLAIGGCGGDEPAPGEIERRLDAGHQRAVENNRQRELTSVRTGRSIRQCLARLNESDQIGPNVLDKDSKPDRDDVLPALRMTQTYRRIASLVEDERFADDQYLAAVIGQKLRLSGNTQWSDTLVDPAGLVMVRSVLNERYERLQGCMTENQF